MIDPDPAAFSQLKANLEQVGLKKLDYIIILHTEQDHSGSVHQLKAMYPEAQVVATKKVQELMETHLHLDKSEVMLVEEGDTLDLGDKTLTFYSIPFAHWPDNTAVYLEEDEVLFSSDLFGSHYATSKVFSTSSNEQRISARNYFAEIMMPFSTQCAKYTAKFRAMNPKLIAPSHGPVWYNPNDIFDLYERWTGSSVRRSVVLAYVSMHESTAKMIEILSLRLASHGLSVIARNIAEEPESLMMETGAAGDLLMPPPLSGTLPYWRSASVLYGYPGQCTKAAMQVLRWSVHSVGPPR